MRRKYKIFYEGGSFLDNLTVQKFGSFQPYIYINGRYITVKPYIKTYATLAMVPDNSLITADNLSFVTADNLTFITAKNKPIIYSNTSSSTTEPAFVPMATYLYANIAIKDGYLTDNYRRFLVDNHGNYLTIK